ncbi:phospholipid-translocating P-type ATPase [Nadsonia fulvescens var. elongata DSM 6958]|uniref:Phospholipid-transporting ATPase n=1 Tax=Nadsonia fulvescens var. elongata DSM 6958 TaxID=857566 RepID=A0A1E3PGA2_9ASCO|nr:phospholipid-translocating P-type ATPase [Nadsonia fulvescens var. elongata DSM 6958]
MPSDPHSDHMDLNDRSSRRVESISSHPPSPSPKIPLPAAPTTTNRQILFADSINTTLANNYRDNVTMSQIINDYASDGDDEVNPNHDYDQRTIPLPTIHDDTTTNSEMLYVVNRDLGHYDESFTPGSPYSYMKSPVFETSSTWGDGNGSSSNHFSTSNNDISEASTTPTVATTNNKETKEANKNKNKMDRKMTTMKRHRWGTQRHKKGKDIAGGAPKRSKSIFRHHNNSSNNNSDINKASTATNEESKSQPRSIFLNMELPSEFIDPETGAPYQQYPRNKIRTTKYTPLSFVPKNFFFQFQNVANVYFLFIVILGIFPIFGVTSPGMAAVPIIVIVVITAFKDAIEDYRRTLLDLELNNTHTQILNNNLNANVVNEDVSLWRRFKKANTRNIISINRAVKDIFAKKKQSVSDKDEDNALTTIKTINSVISDDNMSIYKAYQMKDLSGEGKIDKNQRTKSKQRNTSNQFHPSNPFNTEIEERSDYDEDQDNIVDYDSLSSISMDQSSDNYIPSARDNLTSRAAKTGSVIDPVMDIPHQAKFKIDYWKNVRVGDFVRIKNNDEIPADIVILSTSDTDGACYVETKNLDGETNLKIRQALKCGEGIKHSSDCERAAFWIESEGPHPNLYSYNGVAKWHPHHLQSEIDESKYNSQNRNEEQPLGIEPITINNLLLRGCSLRNTEWVIGVVVFTGTDTKIMLNAGETPTKRSLISRELNTSVIVNFALLFILCLVSGVIESVKWKKTNTSITYFEFGSIGGTYAINGLVTFWASVILYQSLVPISLYISIEIIKTIQAFFIYSDTHMYYEPLDYPCTPKSWNISDDLGQIEYIFSDKTGTLTQNVMEFKKCTINGVNYGKAYTEAYAGMRKRMGINTEEEGATMRREIANDKITMLNGLRQISENDQLYDNDLTFISREFVDDLSGQSGPEQQYANAHFMLALALCHSVITEESEKIKGKRDFKAQSPDEAALVATANDLGFTFVERTQRGVIVNIQGCVQEIQILNTLEFNSTRKRMSAIIKFPAKFGGDDSARERIVLICKGADSVIYSRLKPHEQEELCQKTAQDLQEFANEGLRTLCIAEKELTPQEYQDWNIRHQQAAAALTNREDRMEEVADSIERDLTLLGGTAIEDRLQDGVPDSIALLGMAGIKLWVLTGDKVETAINIGFSCNLLDGDMELLVIKVSESRGRVSEDMAACDAILTEYLSKYFGMQGDDAELQAAKLNHSPPSPNFAIIIDGDALKLALNDDLRVKFLLLCKQCKSVLCCRVSPAQKAAVVNLVKETLGVMTLAIGDGANDVSMIQEADIGVGIVGEEGRQAAMSSDYALGQFRFLTRLLLVHGRWSYKRLSEMIPNFFYKNIVFTFTLFWYGIYNDFDGSYLYDYTYVMLFNLAFTSLPIIIMGILDQDVDDRISLNVPQLYRNGILRLGWSQAKIWVYMFDGIYQSLISFFFPYCLYYTGGFNNMQGMSTDHRFQIGVIVCSIAVISCNVYVIMNQYRWDWISILVVVLSCLSVYIWTGIYSSFTASSEFYKSASIVFGTLGYWTTVLLGVITCLLPHFAYMVFRNIFQPNDVDIVRERWLAGHFNHLPPCNDEVPPLSSVMTNAEHVYSNDKTSFGQEYEDSFMSRESLESINMGNSQVNSKKVSPNNIRHNSVRRTSLNWVNNHIRRASARSGFEFDTNRESYVRPQEDEQPIFSRDAAEEYYNEGSDMVPNDYRPHHLNSNTIQHDPSTQSPNRLSVGITRVVNGGPDPQKADKRVSVDYTRPSGGGIRTSMELPELATVDSLMRVRSHQSGYF